MKYESYGARAAAPVDGLLADRRDRMFHALLALIGRGGQMPVDQTINAIREYTETLAVSVSLEAGDDGAAQPESQSVLDFARARTEIIDRLARSGIGAGN